LKKTILIFCILHLGFVNLTLSQTKFVLGLSDKVGYFQSYEWPEIDSIVGFLLYNEFVPNDDTDVFFDSAYQQIAHSVRHLGDSIWLTDFWANGQLKKKTLYIDKILWWYEEVYCENGQPIYIGPSLNQIGSIIMTTYYCSGQKKSETRFLDSEPHGVFLLWHANGQLESESHFIHGSAEGEWRYWDSAGMLIRTEVYFNDKLIDSK
jgi:MORN repeat variant